MTHQPDLLLAGLLALFAAAWLGKLILSWRRAGHTATSSPDEIAGRWTVGLLLLAVCGSGLLSLMG